MADYLNILTSAGRQKLAAAGAGNKLQLTSMAVGSFPTLPTESMTTLTDETYRAPLNNKAQGITHPERFFAEMLIPSDVGGWDIQEVGLYGKLESEPDELLLAIAQHPKTWKPPHTSGAAKDIVIKFIFPILNADPQNISIELEPSLTYATVPWVNETFVSKLNLLGHAAHTNQRIFENAQQIGLIKTVIGS